MKEENKDAASTDEKRPNPSTQFNEKFMIWALDLQSNKLSLLNTLVTVQRLLLRDSMENDYPPEYINELEGNLMTLQSVIFEA